MDKEDTHTHTYTHTQVHTHTHTHTLEYYSAVKKTKNFPNCSNMDEPGGYYVEVK